PRARSLRKRQARLPRATDRARLRRVAPSTMIRGPRRVPGDPASAIHRPWRVGRMRRRLATAFVFFVAPTAPASRLYGFGGGVLQTMGPATDFAQTGSSYELYWQHYNRGRSALQFAVGYMELGLDGAVQNTISFYHDLALQKNLLAQLQGGPGSGFIVAEYG